jgi:CHAT domain-containing protein/Tfp pilus assembly protein PilF
MKRFAYDVTTCFLLLLGSIALAAAPLTPEQFMDQGWQSFQRGDFEQAAVNWQEAAQRYGQANKTSEQIDALTRLAQAYQGLGQYNQALQSLNEALAGTRQTSDEPRTAAILGAVGSLYLNAGSLDSASQALEDGLQLARRLENRALAALILNNLGNLKTAQKKYDEALAAYRESFELATASRNAPLAVRALTNAATMSLQSGQSNAGKEFLDQAVEQMPALEPSHDKAYGLITAALAYQVLMKRVPDSQESLLLKAAGLLAEAAAIAAAIDDARASSYAWGYLGALYEVEQRYQESLELTRRAIFAGQQAVIPEALYRWHWQTGRLLKALDKPVEALGAYRRAVYALQSIRPELTVTSSTALSFRDSIGPVYFELADLLLQSPDGSTNPPQADANLLEARDAIEMFKVAELRDYFHDECVDAAKSRIKSLEIVSKTAAIIYPIILKDRLELLVSLPTGMKRVSVPVSSEALTKDIRTFRLFLEKRTTREYLPSAQQLYDHLIRPLETMLASLPIDTLVFVPDGPLRTIPMAALHDGKAFLIQRYAVATTPGLTLTDPRPLKRERLKALSVGLSEAVQGFPALPSVSEELEAIHAFYGGTVLLNKDFLASRVEQELKDEPFSLVHIASHGQFGSDPRKSFLLTFDDKLTMDRLDQFIGVFRFRDDPLSLLTLSACETAAGDDRAALGLAGVAIKAGARSAVATLWFINDQASSELVTEFYRQLQNPSASKAAALQRAQVKMIQEGVYNHPAYWAPFLLLNNWL